MNVTVEAGGRSPSPRSEGPAGSARELSIKLPDWLVSRIRNETSGSSAPLKHHSSTNRGSKKGSKSPMGHLLRASMEPVTDYDQMNRHSPERHDRTRPQNGNSFKHKHYN